jgi:hypothetical protein
MDREWTEAEVEAVRRAGEAQDAGRELAAGGAAEGAGKRAA